MNRTTIDIQKMSLLLLIHFAYTGCIESGKRTALDSSITNEALGEDTAPDIPAEPSDTSQETSQPEDIDPPEDTNQPEDTNPPEDTGLSDDTSLPDDTGETVNPIVPTYPSNRVGIFYLTWHAYAAHAINNVPSSQRLVVEDVIQDPSLFFNDMLDDFGRYNEASGFHYHSEPELGFYCLYRKRDSESSGVLDDCPNISHTAETHATQLWNAGVDFVFVDLQNFVIVSVVVSPPFLQKFLLGL